MPRSPGRNHGSAAVAALLVIAMLLALIVDLDRFYDADPGGEAILDSD